MYRNQQFVSSFNRKIPFGILIAFLIAALFVTGWQIAIRQAGKKPTVPFAQDSFNWKSEFVDMLAPLEAAYKSAPNDPAAIQAYAKGLEAILAVKFIPEIAAELTTVNEALLSLGTDSVTTDLLNKQADLYFGIKQFDLAEKAYRDLLSKDSGNNDLRGRLASTLAFQGKYQDALAELQSILAVQPDAFQALAYMGITYAQMGEPEQALSYVKRALENAPSAEARQRLTIFLNKLTGQNNPIVLPEQAEDPLVTKLSQYLKAHAIAGSKFNSVELTNKSLKILFHNFPVEQMPDFAKQKFYQGLADQIGEDDRVNEILLIDQPSQRVMDRMAH